MASECTKATPIFLLIPLFLVVLIATLPKISGLGVNWGTAASHPLPPRKVVELLKANDIAKVKLFDADPHVLQSLSGSGIRVTVGIPNAMLRGLNSSLKAAESWVHDNVTRFVSDGASTVLIEYVAIGNEPFLLSHGEQFHPFLVGAATNIQTALLKANLATRVKVVAPCGSDALLSKPLVPSEVQFRPDINQTMARLLTFLNRHDSPFFVTMSPFETYRENKNFSLDFALFRGTAKDSRGPYKTLFDFSFDAFVSVLTNVGYPRMKIVIGEIGWPTDGAPNATSSLAEEFVNGLIGHLRSRSGESSKHQVLPVEIYILSLFDEDAGSPATTGEDFERHWGVFTFDGQAKYRADLGQGSGLLVSAHDVEYLSARWCVVDNNRDLSNATSLARDACVTAADCTALSPGGSCWGLAWPGNISYAFNSFYQRHGQSVGSCDFAGLGLVTTVDPSADSCRFVVRLSTSCSGPCGPGLFWWTVTLATAVLSSILIRKDGRTVLSARFL